MSGPRDRLIEGTIELVREQGVHGAGLSALLARSGTSRNSLYQHFPAGKGELVEAATRVAGGRVSALIGHVTESGDPEDWLRALLRWAERLLESSDFGGGCPVAGAALAESEPAVQAAAAEAFADWTDRLAAAFRDAGIAADRSRSLAGFVISALEGALVQARALRTTRPLEDVRTNLLPLFDLLRRAEPGP